MKIIGYDTKKSIEYARKFALMRNPKYFNFDLLGGDCTNFVSQCIFAGTGVMNYTKTFGWFYLSLQERAPAWTGVNEFFSFITKNTSVGPFGKLIDIGDISSGDVIQLQNYNGQFYHSLFVTEVVGEEILVCSHSNNKLDAPLSTYNYYNIRVLRIEGARQ